MDSALTTFISHFIKPGASTVPQILEGVVNTAEHVWPSFVETGGPILQKCHARSSSLTVVHKLDESTDEVVKLRHENAELHQQNQHLQEEVARLTSLLKQQSSHSPTILRSCTAASRDIICMATTSSCNPVCTVETTVHPSTTTVSWSRNSPIATSQQQLTQQRITRFNRLPWNLKEFYEQMESNEFSVLEEVYSKCASTKSAHTKRKHVFQFIKNFPGGIEKCFAELGTKSPTWIYDHKIRNCRN